MALHLVDDGDTSVKGAVAFPPVAITQDLLETASYERSGPDLILVTEDGERVTVKDYFSTSAPPDLHAANGAYLSGATVSLLAGPGPVQVAQAGVSDAPGGAPRIGIVERLVGSATVQHIDGSQAQLKDGDPVFQGDVVKVSLDGKLGLSFLDKSVFSLSGGGTMTLNELIYNPDSSSNKMVFGLVNGSLSFVTGAVAPSGGVTVETPVAVMAIRGTIPIAFDAGGGRYLILSDQGTFQVIPKLPGSEVLTIDDSGRAIYFPNGLAGAPTIIDLAGSGFEDEIAELIAQLNAARQDFLQRRADGTGSPDFADFETFAWIEGEAILLQISELLSPLLLETEVAQADIELDFITADTTEAGGQEGAGNSPPVIVEADPEGAAIEDGTLTATGNIAFTDDNDDGYTVLAAATEPGYIGAFTATVLGTVVTWNFAVSNAELQFLAEGQQLTQTYTVTIDDGQGGTVAETVTITITGTNDAPVISSGPQSGAIAEDGTVSAGGSIAFGDVDLTDTHTVSSAPAASGYLGTFSAVLSGSNVAWTFVADNAALQFLSAGDTLTQVYTVAISDGNGGIAEQDVTITITGSNDAPLITSAAQTGAVTEDGILSTGGSIAFTDPDLGDSPSVTSAPAAPGSFFAFSALPAAPGYLGTFTATVSGSLILWQFNVDNADLQFLAAGEVLTQVYTVTIDDGNGGTATQNVTITITGTNDAPVITSGAQNGGIVEDGIVSAAGTITFSDDSVEGTPSASVTPATTGYLGTFAAVLSGSQVDWTFDVDNAALQFLAQGEVLTQTYTVAISDGEGATATQDVTITITGTNDAPVITTEADSGAVAEDGTVAAAGSIGFSDIDLTDTHSAAFSPAATGYLGTFAVAVSGGQVDWTFNVDNAALQFLAEYEVLTQTYTVTVDDGNGGTDTQDVTITITGTNDVPEITSEAQSGDIKEDGAVTAGGTIEFDDPDLADVHSVTVEPADDSYFGSFDATLSGGEVTWTFTVSNAELQYLAEGQTLTQIYSVTVADGHGGTDSQDVTITIEGTNDVPVIGGVTSGTVSEDDVLTSYGQLSIIDADAGQSQFQPQPNFVSLFGTFTVDADGNWTYALDNTDTEVQALENGETLNDSFTVLSADGSKSQVIEIIINGLSEAPDLPPPYNEDGDPNDFNDLGYVALYEPEVTYEGGYENGETWNGTDGNDTISASPAGDTVYGHGGEDLIAGNGGNDADIEEEFDSYAYGLYGQYGNDTITGGAGKDHLYGGSGDDVLYGGTNPHSPLGATDQDTIYGGSGSDTLYGQDGDDDLIGGYGADTLYGGSGKDDFIYLDSRDTGDTIEDFVVGEDLVDLNALLGGNLMLGGQTTVVSANSFNWYQDGANTVVTVDVSGDAIVDLAITLKGVDADTVTENSFSY